MTTIYIIIAFLLGFLLGYLLKRKGKSLVVFDRPIYPVWSLIQRQISEDLHHPDPEFAEMDKLLEKLESLTINLTERAHLEELLILRSEDLSPAISQSQRDSAKIMSTIMKKVVIERYGCK